MTRSCFNGAATFPSRKWTISPSDRVCHSPLQWGRDVSVAEISIDRSSFSADASLQWGRDVSVAEISTRRVTRSRRHGFNGAATFPSRKFPTYTGFFPTYSVLQWGRDVSVAEIVS